MLKKKKSFFISGVFIGQKVMIGLNMFYDHCFWRMFSCVVRVDCLLKNLIFYSYAPFTLCDHIQPHFWREYIIPKKWILWKSVAIFLKGIYYTKKENIVKKYDCKKTVSLHSICSVIKWRQLHINGFFFVLLRLL